MIYYKNHRKNMDNLVFIIHFYDISKTRVSVYTAQGDQTVQVVACVVGNSVHPYT